MVVKVVVEVMVGKVVVVKCHVASDGDREYDDKLQLSSTMMMMMK